MSIEYAPQFETIVSKARAEGKRMRVALAGADSENILKGLFEAEADGFVEPVLIGNYKRIMKMLEALGLKDRNFDLQPIDDSTNVVQYAIEMIKSGNADALMRGNTSTRDLLMPVLNKANHLVREDRINGLLQKLLWFPRQFSAQYRRIGLKHRFPPIFRPIYPHQRRQNHFFLIQVTLRMQQQRKPSL